MEPQFARTAPMDILAVVTDEPGLTSMIAGFRSNSVLVCTSAEHAVEAAPVFRPQVLLIDLRMPDSGSLAADLAALAGDESVLIALVPQASADAEPPAGFQYRAALPLFASELEQLLWQVNRDLEPRRPKPVDDGQENGKAG